MIKKGEDRFWFYDTCDDDCEVLILKDSKLKLDDKYYTLSKTGYVGRRLTAAELLQVDGYNYGYEPNYLILYKNKNYNMASLYHCTDCDHKFEELIQFQKDDKMFQLCPKCKSEEIDLLTDLTEADMIRFLRENKLERILVEKNNIIVKKKST